MADQGFELHRISEAEADVIRNRWIETYVPANFQRHERSLPHWFYWHTFSFESVRHEQDDVARTCFEKSKASLKYIWFARSSLGLYECKTVPDAISNNLTGEIREIHGELADSVWTGDQFAWTYTATHEEEWGLGPYFSMKKWMK